MIALRPKWRGFPTSHWTRSAPTCKESLASRSFDAGDALTARAQARAAVTAERSEGGPYCPSAARAALTEQATGARPNMSCLFCKIVAGEIPAKRVHEDERLLAFEDLNPQAPLHVLVIPKRHIATLNDLQATDDGLVGEMVRRGAAIVQERGFGPSGYRTIFNCNSDAGQTVFHIHLHVLAGRRFG